MALLQIAEPGQSPEPHALKRAVGIDLGTTNSLVATVRNGKPETLPDHDGYMLLPSVVRYTATEKIVGRSAKSAAALDPLNTLISIKRLMGKSGAELKGSDEQFAYDFVNTDSMVPHIQTASGIKTPIEVSADILSELASRSRETLGGELDGVVITVPAYFDDAQRQATKDAANIANLKVLRLLNEPTAAAVAYGLDQKEDGLIAVYDLGGGTFDISILRLSQGVFEVLSTGGDSALGGDDFDYAIMQFISEHLNIDFSQSPQKERQLLNLACHLKEQLSDTEIARGEYIEDGVAQAVELSRDQFNHLVDPLIAKTLLSCKRSLRDADVDKADITNIVMVGGSTRSLRVREKVSELFAREPLIDIDPDKVVAIGAALQADVLVGNKPDSDLLLLDVVPLSLGLETMGGLVEKVIHRNTTIPVTKAQEFTTFKDGQTAMSVHVVQGERELVSDCRSLAKFDLKGIPPMVAGAAHIRITFQVDADGLLSVSAEETSTGVAADITVKPSYGLSDDEVSAMLKDSFANAQVDIAARALREQQVEAERLIEALSVALEENGKELLSDEEYSSLQSAVDKLKVTHNQGDADTIRNEIESLSQLSDSFAAKRMDSNIKKALSGHHLEEFDNTDAGIR
ncbi:MAG: Fe-S protein assembly chaperone HscA [Cellvibrionaceae bacterium]